MTFFLNQFQIYRYFKGGYWIRVNTHLSMNMFWCRLEDMPKCCGSHIFEDELYVRV